MHDWWIPFIAFGACLLTAPLVRTAAIRLDLFDRPDAGLKPHEKPIPYLGGIAIYFGWVAGMIAAGGLNLVTPSQALAVIAAITVLMLTGLIDDLRELPPRVRLAVQMCSPFILVISGTMDTAADQLLIGLGDDLRINDLWPRLVVAFAFAAVVFAGATNATNLIDGLDGLCTGVLAIAALNFAWLFHAYVGMSHGATIGWAVALAMLGACVAFLFFNFNPASMFMGDSGSLALGGMAGLLILSAAAHGAWRGLVAGLLIFGFPIFDTGLAVTRRRLNQRPLFRGDRSHFYDQLRDRGYTVRQTVVRCYIMAALLGIVGNTIMRLPMRWAVIVAIFVPAAAIALSVQAGLLRVDDAAAVSTQPAGGPKQRDDACA